MLTADGESHGFTLEVAADGKVSYLLEGATADSSTAGHDVPEPTTPDGVGCGGRGMHDEQQQ